MNASSQTTHADEQTQICIKSLTARSREKTMTREELPRNDSN